MATLGKRKPNEDLLAKIKTFYMYSWTQDEYLAAISDDTFFGTVMSSFDATSGSEVNFDGTKELSGDAKKKYDLNLKFYYAGGSCRFMFQFSTEQVKTILEYGIRSAQDMSELIRYCGGDFHSDAINRLYGMRPNGRSCARFPVSSYVAFLFANACQPNVIADLAGLLNASNNPSLDGHIFEWLFLASVRHHVVKLFGDDKAEDVLPQANVLTFDPKKRFKVFGDGRIGGNQSWLQPVAWNQGGYDAVYFDMEEGKVIFIQVTRSDTHDLKLTFFFGSAV